MKSTGSGSKKVSTHAASKTLSETKASSKGASGTTSTAPAAASAVDDTWEGVSTATAPGPALGTHGLANYALTEAQRAGVAKFRRAEARYRHRVDNGQVATLPAGRSETPFGAVNFKKNPAEKAGGGEVTTNWNHFGTGPLNKQTPHLRAGAIKTSGKWNGTYTSLLPAASKEVLENVNIATLKYSNPKAFEAQKAKLEKSTASLSPVERKLAAQLTGIAQAEALRHDTGLKGFRAAVRSALDAREGGGAKKNAAGLEPDVFAAFSTNAQMVPTGAKAKVKKELGVGVVGSSAFALAPPGAYKSKKGEVRYNTKVFQAQAKLAAQFSDSSDNDSVGAGPSVAKPKAAADKTAVGDDAKPAALTSPTAAATTHAADTDLGDSEPAAKKHKS